MTSLAIPSAAASTLPAVNIHPHGHGHKKGGPLDPTADTASSSTAAQIPVGSAQNMVSAVCSNSLARRLIGAQPARRQPTALATSTASTAAANAAAAGSKVNVMA